MTTKEKTVTEERPSALGLSSLFISGAAGTLFALLALVFGVLSRFVPSEVDAPGAGIVFLYLMLSLVFALLVSLVLSAVALTRSVRGWQAPAVAWMFSASVLTLALFRGFVWEPLREVPPLEGPPVKSVAGPVAEEEAMMPEQFGPQPGSPPGAILSSARRDAVGFEGTLCWAPNWATNCVEDAGIPLLGERDTVAVQRGEAADLVFVLRASEGEFEEGNPVVEGVSAFPVGQEIEILAGDTGVRYLIPAGKGRALDKTKVDFEANGGLTKVFADVPAGEYIFQVSARPPEGTDSWRLANYHFRVLVLPG
ncbi:MAG: hypothetical protein M3151_01845 [Actinomycetota bacterium]|nr:hypothetical protein [Actinomycetota bacterium]